MFRLLWIDETGGVVSSELILVLTLLVIALFAGFDIHDGILEELADTGEACGDSNQSYDYGGSTNESSATAGSSFVDSLDFCDGPGGVRNSRCLLIVAPAPLVNSGA